MVARIAPSPISSSVAPSGAAAYGVASASAARQTGAESGGRDPSPSQNTGRSKAPTPPAPPGEAFAAAVISGQLSPRPVTPEQLRQRLGAAWQPPASAFRLVDRTA